MTILELFYDVYELGDQSKFDKDVNKVNMYWSVNDNNEQIILGLKDVSYLFHEDAKPCTYDIIEELFLRDEKNWNVWYCEFPKFISYEIIKDLESIHIDSEGKISYIYGFKYPMMCVRGTCDRNCIAEKLNLYCFRDIPCTEKRPDWNCYTAKWPNFFDLITDVIQWMMVCKHMDALVVMFEYPPLENELYLDFNFCTGLLIKDNHILIISDLKVRKLYEEYNKRYPTNDREIESTINYYRDLPGETKFYF